jgi:hypothetical protein
MLQSFRRHRRRRDREERRIGSRARYRLGSKSRRGHRVIFHQGRRIHDGEHRGEKTWVLRKARVGEHVAEKILKIFSFVFSMEIGS